MLGTPIIHDRPAFCGCCRASPGRSCCMIQGVFTEGPVWFADLQCLLWSDIPTNRMMRWTPDGQVGVFRDDSRHANGNTRDREGRLVTLRA